MASLTDGTNYVQGGTITPPPPVTPSGSSTISPAVLTSGAADKHINETIKPALAEATSGIQTQAANTAATKAQQDAQATQDAAAKTQEQLAQAKIAESNAKTAALSGTPPAGMSQADYDASKQANPNIEPNATDVLMNKQSDTIDQGQKALQKAQDEYDAQAKQVHDTILGIQNGTVPLNEGEKAQITGLQQQFQQLIQQQQLANKGAMGLANVRGYQNGSAEYDPTFQVKTIGAIVTAGQNKIADLNIKMASAIANLTQSFKDNDIAAVKDAYNVFKDASDRRTKTIQDTIDAAQKKIDDYNTAQQKVTDAVNKIGEELAKVGAPPDVVNAALTSGSEAQAIAIGSPYFQDPTSLGGQYTAYVNATRAKGLTPMTPGDFIARQKANEAYSNAYAAKKGDLAAQAEADAAALANTPGGSKTLSDAFNSAVLGLSAQQQKVAQKTFQGYLTSGDTEGAKEYILRVATQSMPTDQQNQAVGRYQAVTALNEIQSLLDQANAKGADTNLVSGNIQNAAEKLGAVGDPDLAYIGGRIAAILQVYRRAMTGVAFSPAESKQYEQLFPSTTKTGALNAAKISALKDALDSNNKAALSFYVGDTNYDTLYGKDASTSLPGGSQSDVSAQIDSWAGGDPQKLNKIADLYALPGWTPEKVLEYIQSQSVSIVATP